jgi:hypothetical protein
VAVFDGSDEIGVTGTGAGHNFGGWSLTGLDCHHVFPVFPVFVGYEQADRVPERFAVPDATGKFNAVFFDAHATATPVAFLATGKIAVDHVGGQRETGWNTFEDRQEVFAVRFSPVQIPQHDGVSGIFNS